MEQKTGEIRIETQTKVSDMMRTKRETEEETEGLLDIPEGQVSIVVPPKYLALMTGAEQARQLNNGEVRLIYTDGSEACAHLLYPIADGVSWCKIVRDVQEFVR